MIKKLSIEKKIHLILALLICFSGKYWLIPNSQIITWGQLISLYFSVITWLVVFYTQIFWLFPKYLMNRKIFQYLLCSILLILVLFLLFSLYKSNESFIQIQNTKSFLNVYISLYQEYIYWLQELMGILSFAIFYSVIKELVLLVIKKGWISGKMLIISVISVILIVSLYFTGSSYYYRTFNGSDKIIFIPNTDEIKTLKDLTELKEFKGCVLLLDSWGTYCGPCLREFQNSEQAAILKERYKNKPVKFVYLADGDSSDCTRWKKVIMKYELHGYHMQMNTIFFKNLYSIKGINENKPNFILIDKNGNIANPNASKPSSGEILFKQIDVLL